MSAQGTPSLKAAATRAGVTPQTLRRWANDGNEATELFVARQAQDDA